VRGDVPRISQGNLFMDKLLGAEIRCVSPEQYRNANALMEEIVGELKKEGRTGYAIPEGASDSLGAFGYVRAAEEICSQSRESGIEFDHILHAVGSGGTSAGLLTGKEIFGLRAQVLGVNVCNDEAYFLDKISAIAADMRDRFSIPVSISREDINIIDGYVGRGYALSTPEGLAFITYVARTEGVFLDNAYTGKAFFALADLIRKGRFKKGENVLFIHTGGIFSLFAITEQFDL
jgi:D-cysteine desulfhydrase